MDFYNNFEVVSIMREQVKSYGISCYLVGGAVRDVILEREPVDFDFTAEVNEKEHFKISSEIAKSLGCEMIYNHFYHTAKFLYHGYDIDFVMARRECYESIAAKPKVKASNLYDDLARRDFTVNSMAVSLFNNNLIDPFKGMTDIKDGKLTILHNQSFMDDPTRIFRGIKYASRFNFNFSNETEELVYNAVDRGYINHLSGDRIKSEINSLVNEKNSMACMKLINKYGILSELTDKKININLDIPLRNFDNLLYNDKMILLFCENSTGTLNKLFHRIKLNKRVIEKIEKLKKIRGILNESDEIIYRYLISNAKDLSSQLLESAFYDDKRILNYSRNRDKLNVDFSILKDIEKESIKEEIIEKKIEMLEKLYGG